MGRKWFICSSELARNIPKVMFSGSGSICWKAQTGSMVCLESVRVMWAGGFSIVSCGTRPVAVKWLNFAGLSESDEFVESTVVLWGVSSIGGSSLGKGESRFWFGVLMGAGEKLG